MRAARQQQQQAANAPHLFFVNLKRAAKQAMVAVHCNPNTGRGSRLLETPTSQERCPRATSLFSHVSSPYTSFGGVSGLDGWRRSLCISFYVLYYFMPFWQMTVVIFRHQLQTPAQIDAILPSRPTVTPGLPTWKKQSTKNQKCRLIAKIASFSVLPHGERQQPFDVRVILRFAFESFFFHPPSFAYLNYSTILRTAIMSRSLRSVRAPS